MSDWDGEDDGDDILDALSNAEEVDDITDEEVALMAAFFQDASDEGFYDPMDDYDGPIVNFTVSTTDGEDYIIKVPLEYLSDLIDLAEYYDVEYEIESS